MTPFGDLSAVSGVAFFILGMLVGRWIARTSREELRELIRQEREGEPS